MLFFRPKFGQLVSEVKLLFSARYWIATTVHFVIAFDLILFIESESRSPHPDRHSDMSELSQFEALLSQLMVGDNNIRNHAEKVYNQMQEEKPDQALALLIQTAIASQNAQVSIILLYSYYL